MTETEEFVTGYLKILPIEIKIGIPLFAPGLSTVPNILITQMLLYCSSTGGDMALKRSVQSELVQKQKERRQEEKKMLSSFPIEPSFKDELQGLFSEMGLSWAAGVRFALKEFMKKHSG